MEDEPYEIAIARLCGRVSTPDSKLRDAIVATLRHHQATTAQISVALVDDAGMAELNQTHLGHSGPTDVITFDLRDEKEGPVDGEIVISVDTAQREAGERGHGVDAELALYAVHGLLHLLGYDDRDEAQAARIHAMEDRILSSIGIGPVYGASMH